MQRAKLRMSPSLFGVVLVAVLALGAQSPAFASTTATGRAYEQVSPADKNGFPVHWKPFVGTDVSIRTGLTAAARDGEAAVFTAWGVFAGSENSLPQTYRSRRTPSGWVTTPGSSAVTFYRPEGVGQASPLWWAADYNLTNGLIHTANPWSPLDNNMLDPFPGAVDVYLRNAADEDILVSTDEQGQATGGFDTGGGYLPSLGGEGGHPVFQSKAHIIPEDEGRAEGTYNVYENDGSGTRLVSVAPNGGLADPACGSALPRVGMTQNSGYVGAPQSADGKRVVFETVKYGRDEFDLVCWYLSSSQVYVRVDGNRTVQVSKSQRSEPDPEGTRSASFVGGSEDLSRILFLSQELLSDDADSSGDTFLYEFDLESEELSVAVTAPGLVAGVSADGSSVFFEREGTLFRAKNGTETPVATSSALYFGRAGGGPVSVISSADGNTLLFSVSQNVTSYDAQGTDQVYLWREGEPLSCLSCGEPGTGTPTHAHLAAGDEASNGTEARRFADSLSADASLVTFDTGEKLLPNDTNGRRDVYEYDIETRRISLVSDGKSGQDAFLLGMSRSGRDVFFTTAAGLVPQDTDNTTDLYDARLGGGFPSATGDSAQSCSGEACQPPAALPPATEAPTSSRLNGSGDAKPRRSASCRKAKSAKGKKAQRAKARCAKRTNKSQSKKKGKSSDRRANVPAGKGKGEGK